MLEKKRKEDLAQNCLILHYIQVQCAILLSFAPKKKNKKKNKKGFGTKALVHTYLERKEYNIRGQRVESSESRSIGLPTIKKRVRNPFSFNPFPFLFYPYSIQHTDTKNRIL